MILAKLSRLELYANTLQHLQGSQVAYRLWRKLGGKTPLRRGHVPKPSVHVANISRVPPIPELDFDPAFLARFNCDELLLDSLTLLHMSQRVDWLTSWKSPAMPPLWRYNMHYQEYILPLTKRYLETGEMLYLEKAKEIVLGWIEGNPLREGGPGWDSYPISMRVVVWLAFYGELQPDLDSDRPFLEAMNASLAEQYIHLSQHLEKDILGNHYFENLKAIVLMSIYFDDEKTLALVLPEFQEQLAEQVLHDGAHYELSPMYQKIILEDLLRVLTCLKGRRRGWEIDPRLRAMCEFVYSLERGISRTPLFNDSGNNVAKSAEALLECARDQFGILPEYRTSFREAGYYLLEGECGGHTVRVIFDSGEMGPPHAMGHTHCDALSFECFVDGEPLLVNCGTYSYQGELRAWFRSTEASSAVKINAREQAQCWDDFRVARFGRCLSAEGNGSSARATFRDYAGNVAERTISLLGDMLVIRTALQTAGSATCYYHLAQGAGFELCEGKARITRADQAGLLTCSVTYSGATSLTVRERYRAEEYGLLQRAPTVEAQMRSEQIFVINFSNSKEGG